MRSPTISTKIRQIAEQAVQNPDRVFTNLGHLLDVELLRKADTGLVKTGRREWMGSGQKNRPSTLKQTSVTWNFLGFTHYWAKSLQGYWIIKRKTIAKRLRRAVKSFWNWCRDNRHVEIEKQYRKLCEKLRGYYQYFGLRGNYKMLEVVYEQAQKAWRYWLSLRSQKSAIPWEAFSKLMKLFPFPKPRITQDI